METVTGNTQIESREMMAFRFRILLFAAILFALTIPNAFSGGKIHFEGQFTFPFPSKKTSEKIKTEPWSGEVVGVTDGDTITALNNGIGERIRLYGIDTPEKRQAFGKQAKQFTSSMVFDKTVKVDVRDIDRYGRLVALIEVDGQVLNEALIKNGYAWVYRKYCKADFCEDWLAIESLARSFKAGIWSDPDPMPPWEFRRNQR